MTMGTDVIGRREHAVQAENVVQRRLGRRQHDRQIFRLAAGHHGVDRHLLDRAGLEVGRHEAQHFARIAGRAVEHGEHPRLGRRHHRQPVRPAAVVGGLDLVLQRRQRHPPGLEARRAEARGQRLRHSRLDILCPAAGTEGRQVGAEAVEARQALPLGAVPAPGSLDLLTVLAPYQRRHDLDAQAEGPLKPLVELPGQALRKGGVVLRPHIERDPGGRKRSIDRLQQGACRAVALHDQGKLFRHDAIRLAHKSAVPRCHRAAIPVGPAYRGPANGNGAEARLAPNRFDCKLPAPVVR